MIGKTISHYKIMEKLGEWAWATFIEQKIETQRTV